MAFLNNLDRKLTEIGQGALKKTKDVSDVVKISAAVRDEEGKQAEIFCQMGAYFYRTYSDSSDAQMKAWCDSIRASNALIRQYQDQLTILKGVAFCPNCNAEVPLTSVFCSNCGAKMMPTTAAASVRPEKICPNCGTLGTEGQVFCPNCGNKYVEQEVSFVSSEERMVDPVPEMPAEEPVQTTNCCPNCGKELKEGQIFCINCGKKL